MFTNNLVENTSHTFVNMIRKRWLNNKHHPANMLWWSIFSWPLSFIQTNDSWNPLSTITAYVLHHSLLDNWLFDFLVSDLHIFRKIVQNKRHYEKKNMFVNYIYTYEKKNSQMEHYIKKAKQICSCIIMPSFHISCKRRINSHCLR